MLIRTIIRVNYINLSHICSKEGLGIRDPQTETSYKITKISGF